MVPGLLGPGLQVADAPLLRPEEVVTPRGRGPDGAVDGRARAGQPVPRRPTSEEHEVTRLAGMTRGATAGAATRSVKGDSW